MQHLYSNIKIDSSSYFIKNFGLASMSQRIDDKFYWKLSCDKGSFFYLAGYLRLLNDSIVLLPLETKKISSEINEIKLFDFSAKVETGWSVLFEQEGNMLYGDSIRFLGFNERGGDSIYSFEMRPFYYYKKPNSKSYFDYWFKINTSIKKGILDITAFESYTSDTLFYCSLIPKVTFLDKREGKLRL